RVLRTELRGDPALERKLFGFTALPADEGGAALAAELALAFAGEGRSTLLIEADLRRPTLAQRFELAVAPGLAEHLARALPWRELVRSPFEEGPALLLAGALALDAPGDALARPAMESLLTETRAEYSAVVLLLPACEGASEVARLARA